MNRYRNQTRIDHLNEEVERLTSEREAYRETVLFLARLLGKTMAERDRARDLGTRLEQELTEARSGEYRIHLVNGHE